MMGTVSIIIPVYNSEVTLARCLDSVLASAYKDLEILLLDDGSKDSSFELCQMYAEKDSRIRVFHHDNHGVSYTRNRGLDEATGDYVMFIDSDDTVSTTWVEAYVEAIGNSKADMVVGGITWVHSDGRIGASFPTHIGVFENSVWEYICDQQFCEFGLATNKIYSAQVVSKIRFNIEISVQEDLDFALEVANKSNSIQLINESGYYYNVVENRRIVDPMVVFRNNMKKYQYAKKNQALLQGLIYEQLLSQIYMSAVNSMETYFQTNKKRDVYDCICKQMGSDLLIKNTRQYSQNAILCNILLQRRYILLDFYFWIFFVMKRKIRKKVRAFLCQH